MRTINDFNSEYRYRLWRRETAAAVSVKGKTLKNALFYSVLTAAVLLAFIYSGNKGRGKDYGPFAYNTVLSASMQSVYPKGSLITSWKIKPGEPLKAGLENGTDIVFCKSDNTVVVHRIIEIMENFEDSGQRAFKTQGVNNRAPDTWITYEGNVIGRVTWHIPHAGSVLAFIADNTIFVSAAVTIIIVLVSLLRYALKKEESAK